MSFHDPRLDASQNAFLQRELEHVRSVLFEELRGPMKGRSLVPVSNEVPTGAESDTYNIMQMYGAAKVGGAGYTTTPPRADVSKSKVTNSIVPITNAYGYHLQEIRNAAQAGTPLPMYKARAAKEAMDRKVDDLLLIGNADEGLAGLFNLSGALTTILPSGAVGDTWALKTSDEVYADMVEMENNVVENSLEALIPNTMVLPLNSKKQLMRRMRDGSDVTILKFFLENSENISRVEFSSRLNSAPNAEWTGRRAVVYKNDPMILEAVIPQEFETLPPEIRGYETIINCHMRYGGIRTYQPKGVTYMDNF